MTQPNRREARRLALLLAYSMECTGYSVDDTLAFFAELKPEWASMPEFTVDLCHRMETNRSEIVPRITGVLQKWKLERVAIVERSLLKLAATEIFYFSDIPPRVTINEYLELAKRYANENAPSFVNGILDRLVQIAGKQDFRVSRTTKSASGRQRQK